MRSLILSLLLTSSVHANFLYEVTTEPTGDPGQYLSTFFLTATDPDITAINFIQTGAVSDVPMLSANLLIDDHHPLDPPLWSGIIEVVNDAAYLTTFSGDTFGEELPATVFETITSGRPQFLIENSIGTFRGSDNYDVEQSQQLSVPEPASPTLVLWALAAFGGVVSYLRH